MILKSGLLHSSKIRAGGCVTSRISGFDGFFVQCHVPHLQSNK